MKTGNITGIILAGGKSSRMGTDKALVNIGNKPMIEHIFNLLNRIFPQIIISTNNPDRYVFLGSRTIGDEKSGLGPVGGIYTCLKAMNTPKAFVTACDLPYITEELIRYVIWHAGLGEFVVPSLNGNQLEPLCAIYDKSVAGVLEKMIERNDLSLRNLQYSCKAVVLPVSEDLSFYDEKLFLNINTPGDIGDNRL